MKRTIAGALVVLASLALGAAPAAAKAKHHATAACAEALDEAEGVSAISARFDRVVETFLTSVHDSAQSHASDGDTLAFVQDMTGYVTTLGSSTNDLTTQLGPLVAAYRGSAASCRAGR